MNVPGYVHALFVFFHKRFFKGSAHGHCKTTTKIFARICINLFFTASLFQQPVSFSCARSEPQWFFKIRKQASILRVCAHVYCVYAYSVHARTNLTLAVLSIFCSAVNSTEKKISVTCLLHCNRQTVAIISHAIISVGHTCTCSQHRLAG